MFAAVGNHVTALHRNRIGGLDLPEDLDCGAYRLLTAQDLAAIFAKAAK
jgi:16S rRNA pseudouridine516 synthase